MMGLKYRWSVSMEFSSGQADRGRLIEAQAFSAKAILIGTYEEKQKTQASLHLDELERLVDTFGLLSVQKLLCPLRKISAKTLLGKGKVEEIRDLVVAEEVTLVIFDDEISPQQQRNLEKILGAMVVDRTELILAVFAQRAHTKEAKMQIALAQYQYQLPRLKRLWTHLGRQRVGGSKGGFLKGEGERQIEIDRRLLRRKITVLRKSLEELKKNRSIKRRRREKEHLVTFAIVGYTNAGKSTLLNALTNAGVFVEDKLFATLDTKSTVYHLPNNQKILLIDTVGFVRKLPHRIIEAFKSTLEEAAHADILLHLIDASSKTVLEEIEAASEVLKELHADKKPMIQVLNKTELPLSKEASALQFRYPKLVKISALEQKNFSQLIDAMMEKIQNLRRRLVFRFDQKDYQYAAKLMQEGEVLSKSYEGNDLIIEVQVPERIQKQFSQFIEPA